MSSGYATSISGTASSSSSSRFGGSSRISSGRGGSGNIVRASELSLDLVDETEILQRIRLDEALDPQVKTIYSGRGGAGNIISASENQWIPFDISADPDDMYEEIVKEDFQKAKVDQVSSTGRGGSGNLKQPPSKGKKDKSRRKRAPTSFRFTISTGSEHPEPQIIDLEPGSLSPSTTASPLTPGPPPTPTLFQTLPKERQWRATGRGGAGKSKSANERHKEHGEKVGRKWWKFGRRQRIKGGVIHVQEADVVAQGAVVVVQEVDAHATKPLVRVQDSCPKDNAPQQVDDDGDDEAEEEEDEDDDDYEDEDVEGEDVEVWKLQTVREDDSDIDV